MITHPSPIDPKPQGLTDLVLAEVQAPDRLDPERRSTVVRQLASSYPTTDQPRLRLDSWRILAAQDGPLVERPFQWSPLHARRVLGMAAAKRVISGGSASPLGGVRAEISSVLRRAEQRGASPSSLATWLAEAPRGVRGAVLGQAANYATDLVTMLDWARLGERAKVGGPDPVWAVPGAPWASLRGRRDVEVALDPVRGTRALICMRSKAPNHDSADDLRIVALVDALTHVNGPMATRVVGVWPEAGRSISLEVDGTDLDRAIALTSRAAGHIRRPEAIPTMSRSLQHQAA